MKRRVRFPEKFPIPDTPDFKGEIIKDILYRIDYQTALRHEAVKVTQKEMINALNELPTGILVEWYMALIRFTRDLMHAGYELNGFKVLDEPFDVIRNLMKKDPDFDIKKYIF